MKKYFPIAVALAALAGVGLVSISASAQDAIPGYASDGSVVAVPGGAQQQHQLRARAVSAAPQHDRQPKSGTPGGIPGYGADGGLIDIN